ncbi:spore germination protein [Bacillus thuringiensis]|nr:spore germination protein [Bacillus thuringiensis]
MQVFPSISENINYIKNFFYHSHDLKAYQFTLMQKKCVIFYFETLIDQDKLEHKLFIPLSECPTIDHIMNSFTLGHFHKTAKFDDITSKMMNGFAILYIDGEQHVFLIDTAANFERTTDEPQNEKVVRGSHQGFVESLTINLNLLRKRIEDESLYIEYYTIGKKAKSKMAIAYMKGIAAKDVVHDVQKRLKSISVDMSFNPGNIEEFLEDSASSPFPQMLNTERPDRVEANLMEGRIAIFMEGSPTVLIIPVTFFSFYQSPDDYNSRAYIGTFVRIVRISSFLIAVTLPAIYIAVIGFHFEVLPKELLITVKGLVDKVPYPPLIEAIIMELMIELIREAGIRLPSAIGPTIGIVGGLVIGDAIVRAGLVSNTMVVVVATTAIASYVIPSNEMSAAVRLLRFPMMIAAATLGYVGIVFGLMALLIHLCKLESVGTPYLAPIAPFHWRDLKDSIVRLPVWKLKNRPLDPHPEEMKQEYSSREWNKIDKK